MLAVLNHKTAHEMLEIPKFCLLLAETAY